MNDPKKIKKVSDDVIRKMGWEKLINQNMIDEGKIQNLVRAMENSENENRLADIVADELDRQFHTSLPKRKRK